MHIRSVSETKKGIIFITAYPDFVYDSFEVQTFRFLIKPIKKDKLFEAITSFRYRDYKDRTIIINVNKTNHIVNINEIYYIEVYQKTTTLHLVNKNLKCHRTMISLEEDLPMNCFGQIQRSYLVSFDKIASWNSRKVILNNGKELDLSPKYCAEFIEKYLLWLHNFK